MGLTQALVVAAAAILVLPEVAAAQGLGDASKKEKARREQTKAPNAKTYTQDELATLPPVANEPAPTTGEEAPPAAGTSGRSGARAVAPFFPEETSAEPEGSTRGDEALWRTNVAQARARVDRARASHQRLAGLNLVPGYEYQDESGRTVIGSVEQLQGLTASAKRELDAAEKALADLLEEARRAGVPPGWLR
jgi:hypothetical protein